MFDYNAVINLLITIVSIGAIVTTILAFIYFSSFFLTRTIKDWRNISK